jgi:ribosome-binding factor A
MTRRTERVAEAVQEMIADLLVREIKDPRIGMVTVTGVKVSADLRHARVYFSVLGDREKREQSLRGLHSAAGFIRTQLARGLKLRVVPEIVFEFDPSVERADRVARLLKEALREETDS